jgi:AcrR family transcriptional regulator
MRKRLETEQYICDKLIEMMEQTPFHKIKVVDLLKYCGISKGTFYTYFDSIYSVVQKIEDDYFDKLAVLNEDTNRLTGMASLASARKLKSVLRVFRALCSPNGDPAFQARLVSHVKNRLKCKFAALPLNISAAETAVIIEYIANGQVCMLKWWAFHEEDEISLNNFVTVSQDMLSGSIDTVLNKFRIAPK